MPRITRVYTRTGDDGTTALATGRRIQKDDLRVIAYGEVDELNSAIGVALAQGLSDPLPDMLSRVQQRLFVLGAHLALAHDAGENQAPPHLTSEHVEQLEQWMDDLSASLRPLKNFVLPGGAPGAAQLHLARCVCRRAERCCVALAQREAALPTVLPFLNRLSDLLFVMARYENKRRDAGETCWQPREEDDPARPPADSAGK